MGRRSRQMTKSKAARLKYKRSHTAGWMKRLRRELHANGPAPVRIVRK